MQRPNAITMEITTFCQANCIVCVRDQIKYPLSNMTQELFEKTIREADSYYKAEGGVNYIDLGGMGEPLLDSQIESKLRWLDDNYPEIKVGVTTNGQLLMQKKDIICKYIDLLKISNYGFSKESFEKVHRGSLVYEDVKNSIEVFLKISRDERPETIMSFLALKENNGEEEAWREYWEGKCEQIYIWRPHNWAGYKESHTEQIHEKCRSCGRPGNDFTIRANGDVSVCCWDFNRELVVGNINEKTFQEICEGKELKDIIEMHRNKTFFEHDTICQHCDQLYDRSDSLLYSSNKKFTVNMRSTVDNVK